MNLNNKAQNTMNSNQFSLAATRTSAAPAFVDGQPVLAQRILPAHRRFTVPSDRAALVVRDSAAAHVLEAGDHRVRGFFQSTPELYLYRPGAHFLPLWITGLATADGKAINLGWRIQVQVTDVFRTWEVWLRNLAGEWLPIPAEQVSARVADLAQELVQRYGLSDLRTDANVRRTVAGELSLLLHKQLAEYGLEFAAAFDPQQMRFMTEADVVAAQREREALQRVLADERLQTEINRIDNEEALAYRLQEAAAARGVPLDAQGAADMAQAAGANTTQPAAATLQQNLAAPAARPTPAPVHLNGADHRARHHVFQRLSLLVLVTSLVAALALAAIWIFRPDLVATVDGRNQVIAAVAGIAILGVLTAWVIDQIIRWEAHRSAERMLIEANLEDNEVKDSRLHLRHILMLLAALLSVGVTAAVLWMPDHVNWLRMVGSLLGLLGAAFAIRIDWLYNINQANRVMARARHRIATARLTNAQRTRNHVKLQASLAAELAVVHQRLADSAGPAYRTLRDRQLVQRINRLLDTVEALQGRVESLEQALQQRSDEEWSAVDEHMERLAEHVAACAAAAQALHTAAQQNNRVEAPRQMDKLEAAVHNMADELTRWQATAT